jgi:hypothetical protein
MLIWAAQTKKKGKLGLHMAFSVQYHLWNDVNSSSLEFEWKNGINDYETD